MPEKVYSETKKMRIRREVSYHFLQRMTVESCGTEEFAPRMLELALDRAANSTDRDNQAGAVLASPNLDLVFGWNGFHPGMGVHLSAALSAIYDGVRSHRPVAGSILFLPWSPDQHSAAAIIACGVAAVITWEPLLRLTEDSLRQELLSAQALFKDSDTTLHTYSGPIVSNTTIKFNSKELIIKDAR